MKRKVRTFLIYSVSLGAGVGLAFYVNAIARLDPFSEIRKQPSGNANMISVSFKNLEMRAWKSARLVTQSHVASLDVSKDYKMFQLENVTQGTYFAKNNQFHYSAKRAMWNQSVEQLQAFEDDHVTTKDMDLKSNGFIYDSRHEVMTMPTGFSGKIGGGQARSESLIYSVKSGSYKTGAISWQGVIGVNIQDPSDPANGTKKTWQVQGKTSSGSADGNQSIFYAASGSDGEVAVKCPKVVWDRKKDIYYCSGPVKYWSAKVNLICDQAVVYRKEKHIVLMGNVVMFVKPKDKQILDSTVEVPPFNPMVPDDVSKDRPPAPVPLNAGDKKLDSDLRSSETIKLYPATIRAEKIEYFYAKGKRHAIITGLPQAQQELPGGRWRRVWTDHAYYDGEAETLKLMSSKDKFDTRMKNSFGDDMTATWFLVSTKDGDQTTEGQDIQGKVISDDDEVNDASGKAAPDKKTTPKTPPAKDNSGLTGPIGH